MINNLYFKNVPNIDLLFFEQILFSYESIPIVFICIDKNKGRYLCVCDDIIDEESWLIVKIDNTELLEILNDNATVLSGFINKKVIIANREFNQNIKYEITEYNNISKDDLPASDQYLEMKDNLKKYIEKIECEISCPNLKLSLSSFEMIEDETDNSNMVISVKKVSDSELHDDLLINYNINSVFNNFSNSSITMEIKCKETDNELSNYTEEALIAYAA